MEVEEFIEFDYRTMLCDVDVSDMTGWNTFIIREKIADNKFPKPLNPGCRNLYWEQSRVYARYEQSIYSRPGELERDAIEAHNDVYESVREEALTSARAQAREQIARPDNDKIQSNATDLVERLIVRDVQNGITDTEVLDQLRDEYLEQAVSELSELAEEDFETAVEECVQLIVEFKARQAALGQAGTL